MLKKSIFAFLLIFILPLQAQDFSGIEIETVPIGNNFYVLYGSGGNIGVFAGEDGLIMIDSQFAPLSERITDAVERISGDSINFVINTHWHGDHTGGNGNFSADGAVIVAHEYVKRRMSMEVFLPLYNSRTMPSSIGALPTVTFMKDISFHSGNETITATHAPYAHTDTDAFVHFENSNIIHMGDLLWTGSYPRIDVQHGGGTVEGVINALGKALQLANGDTQFISGHGAIPEKGTSYVENYLAMLRAVSNRVSSMIAEGMSQQQIIAARPTAEFDAAFLAENAYIDAEMFTRIVYISLSK
ncbi:MAG: MBL fold metallo-hydrolase [Gammaproteobacteria bacterium]|jgi:cyclase|nr:MBL fold metallo-hydrolase [Gammaproteobacteria bacterium]